MKDWFEWPLRRHFNVAWRWALVAAIVLVGPTQKIMQLKGGLVSIGWIPWKLPQGSFWDGAALFLIVLLSYLTVGVVSKQVEKEWRKEYETWLVTGLVGGVVASLIALGIATNIQNHSDLTAAVTSLGLLYAIFLGLAVGSVAPEKKLGEGATDIMAIFLSCGLTIILTLAVVVGSVSLLVIELGLLLVVVASFGLTKFVRFLNQKSVFSKIGRWLIAE